MKKAIIAGVILILAGIALLAGTIVRSDFDPSKFETAEYVTKTYSVDGPFHNIEISDPTADIELTPSADGTCQVICLEDDKISHSVFVENDTLKIETVDEGEWFDHISFITRTRTVKVVLPGDAYASLIARGQTGDILIPENYTFDSADLALSTGDVTFRAPIKGTLSIVQQTGDISIEGISSNRLDLHSSTGEVRVRGVKIAEDVSIQTDTGEVTLSDLTSSALTISTSTGDVSLSDVFVSGLLNIDSSTGDVDFKNSDAGTVSVKTSTGDVTGTFSSEKVFFTKSSSGDVSVPQTTSGGKCEITTSTGDVSIALS